MPPSFKSSGQFSYKLFESNETDRTDVFTEMRISCLHAQEERR